MRVLASALSVILILGCAHSRPQEQSPRAYVAREALPRAASVAGGNIVLASAPSSGARPELPGPASGPVPDYDRFASPDGEITDIRGAWAAVQNPDQVERLYADAIRGDRRATRVCLELEEYFRAIGSNVAERLGALDCFALPVLCRPDWVAVGARTVQSRSFAGTPTANLPAAMAAESRAMPAAAVETTKLYRAVSEAELSQIQTTGKFHPGPNSLGGKWFAETAEDAAKWGARLSGPGQFRIIEVELPKPVADKLIRRARLDSIGPARYGELDQLEGAVIKEVR